MKNSFIIIFFLFISSGLSAQWMSVEDGSTGGVRTLKFKNENTGWYISGLKNIYKTTNSGVNWKCLDISNIFYKGSINEIFNIGDTLLVPIDSSRIMRSDNGGNNWFEYPVIANKELSEITSAGNYLYAVTHTSVGTSNLIRSSDKGNIWTQIYSFPITSRRLHFIDSLTGFIQVYNSIYKTTNRGLNWSVIYDNTVQLDFMRFISDSIGFYIKGSHNLYRTTDGGSTWNFILVGGTKDIIFESENTGYMIADKSSTTADSCFFYKTTNAGATWFRKYSTYIGLSYTEFLDLEKINNTFYIAAGSGGAVFKSSNLGESWIDMRKAISRTTLHTVDFLNDNTGFIGGMHSGILQTTNGGNNWLSNISFSQAANVGRRVIYKIEFTDANTGWASTDSGFYKTTTGGVNWFFHNSPIKGYPIFDYINNNTGWFVRAGGFNDMEIYKTTNGGASYQLLRSSEIRSYSDIEFLDSLYGYITFDDIFNGLSYMRTTNGGATWDSMSFGQVFTVDIISRDVSYIAGTKSFGIKKTTDGGDTWFQVFDIPGEFIAQDLKFINSNTGFCINRNIDLPISMVHFTTNAGVNWHTQTLGSETSVTNIYMNKSGTGFIVGDEGKIYKTTNYGGLVGIINNTEIMPETFSLHQNYPNPFNPSTKIKFDIRKSGLVKLIVYDILGKEMQRLIDKEITAGSYTADFDGSALSSGVYFYRLIYNGTPIETKKMLLLK